MKACICQICTCGRHRCPHNPRPLPQRGGPCALSEYTQKYKEHPLERREPFKPLHAPPQATGPIEDATTNRVDYVKHPLERPHVHQPERYHTPEGNFDHMTNYKRDYIERPFEKRAPIKRDEARKALGRFAGTPTYKSDYRKWSVDRTMPVIKDAGYRPNSAPFEGMSNYTNCYKGHVAPPRSSMKPMEAKIQSDIPFDDKTGYRDDYIKHPLPARYEKERPVYKPNAAGLDDLTTHRKDYTEKKADKMASCKPEGGAYVSDAPFQDDTTQRVDFKKWPTVRPAFHEPDRYMTPEGDFCFDTTQKIDYDKKAIPRVAPCRPAARKSAPGKFDGQTNYDHDYRKWPVTGRVQPKEAPAYMPPDAPFAGTPTYMRDYIKHNAAPPRSMKPVETNISSNVPFDGQTGYTVDYVKHALPPRFVPEKPVYKANAAGLDDMTTHKRDYTEKRAEKMATCKPEGGAYMSDAPFQDDTTQRVDFKKWPTNRPYVHEPDRYRTPEGNFDFSTTHRKEFIEKPIHRAEIRKPAPRQAAPGKFDGTTNYTEDYRKWGQTQREKPKPRIDYIAPEVPFEGSTNYQDDYIGRKAPPRSSMKPADRGVGSNQPFDGNTQYRTDYIKKEAPPCPVVLIEAGRSNFVLKEQDPSGHKYYAPMAGATAISVA